ncbi:MAG: hypothetical protein ACRDLR_05160 [Gaiellaceae bacterium]
MLLSAVSGEQSTLPVSEAIVQSGDGRTSLLQSRVRDATAVTTSDPARRVL